MLMMLAGFGHMRQPRGHVADRVWKYRENKGQLMLMMPAGFGHIRKTGGR